MRDLGRLFHVPDEGPQRSFTRARGMVLTSVVFVLCVTGVVATLVPFSVSVRARGEVHPESVIQVRAPVSGILSSIPVDAGHLVDSTAVLATFDPVELDDDLSAARRALATKRLAIVEERRAREARVRSRQIELDLAHWRLVEVEADARSALADLDLLRESLDTSFETVELGEHIVADRARAEVETARLAVEEARLNHSIARDRTDAFEALEAELEELAARVATLVRHRRRLTIRASRGGVVLTDRLEELRGARVEAGDLIMELAPPHRWRVTLMVDEAAAARIASGDPVRFRSQASIEEAKWIDARVSFVGVEPATVDPGQVAPSQYRVELELQPSASTVLQELATRRGFTVDARIVTGETTLIELLRSQIIRVLS